MLRAEERKRERARLMKLYRDDYLRRVAAAESRDQEGRRPTARNNDTPDTDLIFEDFVVHFSQYRFENFRGVSERNNQTQHWGSCSPTRTRQYAVQRCVRVRGSWRSRTAVMRRGMRQLIRPPTTWCG